MKRSSKRLAAVAATLMLGSVGLASATMAEDEGLGGEPSSHAAMDDRAAAHITPVTTETTFVSVRPCRLFDTRNAGGPMANQATRDFSVKGALSGQGGAANCGVPEGATAASINLTAISQGGTSGFVRGWPAGGAQVTSTLLNFTPAPNASNSLEVPLCEGACAKDLTLKTFGSVHLVGEVLGYHVPQIHGEISLEGDIRRGSSAVVSAERLLEGYYEVTLDRNIEGCGVLAYSPRTILSHPNGNKVVASTFDFNNDRTDMFWKFVVNC